MSFGSDSSDQALDANEPLVIVVTDDFVEIQDAESPDGTNVVRLEEPGTSTSPAIGAASSASADMVRSEHPGPSTSHATGSSARRKHMYSAEIRSQWNLIRVHEQTGTLEQATRFAEDRGLILSSKNCSYHKRPMKLYKSHTQLGLFMCSKSKCRTKAISRANGTWFENARLPLPVIFKIMYCFVRSYSYELTKIECHTIGDVALSSCTISDWFNYCRETIVVYELENSGDRPKIGGPGRIVQLDESKFGKRKYNRGRQVEGHWVLGMIEDGSDDLRLELCPDNLRTSEVLVPLIQKHVAEGSVIHTDYWRAYDCLSNLNYIHKKVNHSDPINKFVAPDGTHTQRIESHWRVLKSRFNKDNYKGNFTDWLIEYSWRRKIALEHKDPFDELINCIKYVYKV